MRQTFIDTMTELLDEDPRAALVLAEISAAGFAKALANHPDRALNVGIREQLMLGVCGGLALTGLRPVAHSYATFLIDRAYEQVKLDLGHQGVGAVLVSTGASFDGSQMGYTHMSPMDVSLLDTLGGWKVHTPGHPADVARMLRAALDHDDPVYIRLSTQVNRETVPGAEKLVPLQRSGEPLVIAVGPMLDPVLEATRDLPVTVAYTDTPRPLDTAGLRSLVGELPQVIIIEPYHEGTSAHLISEALSDRPHRLHSIGVGRQDLHRFGSPADHNRWHGLDPAALRRRISSLMDQPRV